jgi:hypothetical protein
MTYLAGVAALLFAWLYCYKTVRFHGAVVFHLYNATGTAGNRDLFDRIYSIAHNVFGGLLGGVAIIVIISHYLNTH